MRDDPAFPHAPRTNSQAIDAACRRSGATMPVLGLTTQQAAEALGVSVRTLEGWRIRGGGPPFAKLSRTVVRYLPEDLRAWLAQRVVENTAQAGALA